MSKKNPIVKLEDLDLKPEELEALVVGAQVLFPQTDPQEDETPTFTTSGETRP